MGQEQLVTVEGHRLRLTNLDKVLYPETGTTKGDVLSYYTEIAAVMLPHIRNRPVTRKRWVHGVGTDDAPGAVFFQKNLDASTPEWVVRRPITHKTHTNDYPLVGDLATLVWLAQMAALEIHVPQWQFGRTGTVHNPDRLVLDLDPGPGIGLAECAEVARHARGILRDMGLDPMPVTSGSKGIHLYAALDGKQTSDEVSLVAHELARALEADHPDLVVSEMKKTLREGKVLVDWSQNNRNKTTVAPYSLRGRSRPSVAAPRTWRELASPKLTQLDYEEVLRRVRRRGDPLADLTAGSLAALEPTAERLAGFDRLEKYRSMRDDSKTPEPVPQHAPSGTGSDAADRPSFVIQEHHARNLHWDFRLEHDGVLVSWALPKGVPTDPKQNHLAVQTEDHPREYGTFEGSIPAGQYGAGEVTIWDRGWFELEKWRDGKEVIAILHGETHGTAKYALIHTGHEGNNWLIHLMVTDAAAPSPARTRSTVTGSRRKRTSGPTPMLASNGAPADFATGTAAAGDWAFEMKWDGVRAIARIADGAVTLTSRNGIDLTPTFPDLADIGDQVTGDATIDGEIVAIDRHGRPDFGRLQTRLGLTKRQEASAAAEGTPVQFLAFDVLEADQPEGTGRSLLRHSYRERRDILQSIISADGRMQVPPEFDGNFDAAMASSRELGLEGVMAKKLASTYTPGRRSGSWLKVKHHRTQEIVVGGWRTGKGNRADTIGSLLVGIPDGPGLRYVGRVGTGFSDRDLAAISTRLARMERKTSPFTDVPAEDASDARWVSATLVGEVEFAEWTPTRRLRQPSWRGWRPDKDPDGVVEEPS